jgi:hypothetical protein
MASTVADDDDIDMAGQQLLSEAEREASPSRVPRRTTSNQRAEELTLVDDLDALDLGEGADLSDDESVVSRKLEVLVVIPRDQKKHPHEMESVPLKYVKEFFNGKIDPKNYTWGLQDESNNFRPSPVAFWDMEHPPGTTGKEKGERRQENWKRIQDDCGYRLKAFAERVSYEPLSRDDQAARYKTVSGEEHVRRWEYKHTDKSGEEMPALRITRQSSSVPWGHRYIHYFSNNPKVAGKLPSDLAEKYGPENVNVKTVDGRFPTVKKLNERGRFEADREFAMLIGQKYLYNRTLPTAVVQYGDSLISVSLINDQSKWKARPELAKLHAKLQKNPKSLTVGVLNEEGSTYVTPDFVARSQPNHYAAVKAAHNLPDDVAKCNKRVQGEKNWVQLSKDVIGTTDAARKGLAPGQTIADKYPDVQMFSPKLKDGKPTGSLKMVYTTKRDREEITQSVADDFGIKAQANHYEQQRDRVKSAAPTKDAALQAVYDEGGYDSDSSTNSRSSMISNRAGDREQQGRSH